MKVHCRRTTQLPGVGTTPLCVKETLSFWGCCVFRDALSSGLLMQGCLCFGMCSDPGCSDFTYHMKVSGMVDYIWENNLNLF